MSFLHLNVNTFALEELRLEAGVKMKGKTDKK